MSHDPAIRQALALLHAEDYVVQLKPDPMFDETIEGCFEDETITVIGDDADDLWIMAQTLDGKPLGLLPRRGKLMDALKRGDRIVGVQVKNVRSDWELPQAIMRVEVKCIPGEYASAFDPPAAPAKTYPVGIVGERNYQEAIALCVPGESTLLFHEPDNPYDDAAIAVVSPRGSTIGYLPRDSWLGAALVEEGKGYTATVKNIEKNEAGLLWVVVNVSLTGDLIGEREFSR